MTPATILLVILLTVLVGEPSADADHINAPVLALIIYTALPLVVEIFEQVPNAVSVTPT